MKIVDSSNISEQLKEFSAYATKKDGIDYVLLTMNNNPVSITIGDVRCNSTYRDTQKGKISLEKNIVKEDEEFCFFNINNEKIILNQISLARNMEEFENKVENKIIKNQKN